MKRVCCSLCGKALVRGAEAYMMQSERFPSVYLHSTICTQSIFHVLVVQMGLSPTNPLMMELMRDEEIMSLHREGSM